MAQRQVEELLNARAEIDEQLRRHKNLLTVMFTDVVGSTSYFDRFGDTAGLAMVHLNAELGSTAVREFGGTVVKTIGDSVMADFPEPKSAVRAAVTMQRRLAELNSALPEHRRMQIRIGLHTGMGFRKGSDVFGDVVNLAARITKRTEAGQILISRSVREGIAPDADIACQWLDKCTIDGRTEREDIFEVVWTDVAAYTELRRKLHNVHSDARAEAQIAPQLPSRYEVLCKIGQGGVGIVYKARDLQTNEILAVKVLKPEAASDATAQANFSKELCLARKITHKNVCRIYDLYRSDGIAYATMEYVEGENLLSIISREGKMPVSKALGILKQLCCGLREAHAQGVIHRDLKPANIMVDQTGTVKIMDFGIARLMKTDVGQTGTIVGTPAYMSPEQARGRSVDARSDIYAIGLILYEMITGTATFGGDTAVAIALKHLTETPNLPRDLVPTISEGIEAVVLKCLEKEPLKRFQSVGELAKILEDTENLITSPSPALNERKAWLSERLIEIERYISDLQIGKKIDQAMSALTNNLSKPLPKRLSLGNLQVDTRQALILASVVFLAPLIAWTALGHSANSSARVIEKPTSPTSGDNQASPLLVSAPAVPYPVAMPSASATGGVDSDDAIQTRHQKPEPRSKAKVAKAQSFLQPTTTLALPLPTTVVPPQSLTPLVTSTASPTDNSSINTRDDVPVSSHPSGFIEQEAATEIYFDVGSFKDPKWADNAAETLGKLGFHVTSLHKGKLWMNSYHVIVGPFHNDDMAQAARRDLESHGFKPRITKLD